MRPVRGKMEAMGKKSIIAGKGKLLVSLTLAGIVGLWRGSALATVNIQCSGNLDFGTMAPGPGGGVVEVTPNGARSVVSGNVTLMGGAVIVPSCLVTWTMPQPVQISVATASINITNGTDTMTIDDFNIENDGAGPVYISSGSSAPVVDIGASLHVGNPQGAGAYSGTFTVTVSTF